MQFSCDPSPKSEDPAAQPNKKGSEPFSDSEPLILAAANDGLQVVFVDDFPTLNRHDVAVDLYVDVFRDEPHAAVPKQELATAFVIAAYFGQPVISANTAIIGQTDTQSASLSGPSWIAHIRTNSGLTNQTGVHLGRKISNLTGLRIATGEASIDLSV
jgi:hypothetical protein